MQKLKLKSIVCFLFIVSISCNSVFASEDLDKKVIKIAAGSILEGYYFIGLRLCRYITESNNGIRCEVVPTSGSLENIGLLKNQEVDFAFALGNLAVDAHKGKGYFVDSKPFDDIVQLLRLHDEAFTVIAKDKDKIFMFGDLDGKKISNGPRNSDSTIAYVALSSYYDFKQEPEDIEMSHEDYAHQFCGGKIDAIILMTGHPNALVNHITHSCESDFVSIERDKIDMLIKNNAAFKAYTIDEKGYPGIDRSEQTVAASAVFITRKSVPREIVSNLMSYLKSRIDQFKLSDPLLYDLDKDHFTSGFVLPAINDK
jgi:uncharacterized protein